MAISRKRKDELIEQYVGLLERSQAVIIANASGQPTKVTYQLRAKVRDSQGEFHVVKNTLMAHALQQRGQPVPDSLMDGPSAITFCFGDLAALSKLMIQFADENEGFVIKGGLLGNRLMDAAGVKALSDLPSYPVMMAHVLGTLQAPGGRLAGVLGAALRQIAAVVQARVDQLQAAQGVA